MAHLNLMTSNLFDTILDEVILQFVSWLNWLYSAINNQKSDILNIWQSTESGFIEMNNPWEKCKTKGRPQYTIINNRPIDNHDVDSKNCLNKRCN